MFNKRIAVFIPCYNSARTIAATLTSVQTAVANAPAPVAVFLYDDCSTDASLAVAKESWKEDSPLHIRSNPANSGERKTTNQAFTDLSGDFDWIFIIHADDIVKPDWLSTMMEEISRVDDDKCFTVWSSFDSLDDGTGATKAGDNSGAVTIRDRTRDEKIAYIVKLYGNWHISGAALNVRLFHLLGGFDITMPQFGDTDFFTRGLLAGYSDVYISRTLTFYRVISNSVSAVSVKTNRDIREIVYILQKFEPTLDSRQRRQLRRRLNRLAGKRAVKWLLKGSLSNSFYCLKVTLQTLI